MLGASVDLRRRNDLRSLGWRSLWVKLLQAGPLRAGQLRGLSGFKLRVYSIYVHHGQLDLYDTTETISCLHPLMMSIDSAFDTHIFIRLRYRENFPGITEKKSL